MGCESGLVLSGVRHPGYSISLGSASIRGNAAFVGGTVQLAHPGNLITVTNGQWGGVFSNVSDSDGAPRLVAGTFAAESGTPGIHAVFAGAFAAGKR